uniref:Transcription factor CBF/NF-Y/archaeal histone domain-containing protein n=1 Tax=Kalanchoe fedtschenkoi TaxID=63787 RepID=A0A7N0TAR7_KALFE
MVDNRGTNLSGRDLKLTYEGESSGAAANQEGVLKEQDHLLPIANVGRMMKQILPPNAKISKEAKETMQECVSEFISFVTGDAADKCRKEKRKTLNGDDICWALGSLGFDDYAATMKRYLLRYRELESDRANQNRVGNNEQNDIDPPPADNPDAVSGSIAPTTINFNL